MSGRAEHGAATRSLLDAGRSGAWHVLGRNGTVRRFVKGTKPDTRGHVLCHFLGETSRTGESKETEKIARERGQGGSGCSKAWGFFWG